MEQKRDNKALAISYAYALGYNKKQVKCLITLWTRESRFDHLAKNRAGSSAFGITQLLREKDRRAEYQILHGIRYIQKRYQGNFCRALAFHLRHRWY